MNRRKEGVTIVPCPALPCPALPCPALPCPVLSCSALSCQACQGFIAGYCVYDGYSLGGVVSLRGGGGEGVH